MKRFVEYLLVVFLLFLNNLAYGGEFNSGSTGADGAFNPTTNVELQLSPNGIFNFTTVNIPLGITVTFKKNADNTPVYILATGDVIIAGSINLDGTPGNGTLPGIGGTGGFGGGYGGPFNTIGGKGLGPGGGAPGAFTENYAVNTGAGGGGFGSAGVSVGGGNRGGVAYGNIRIIPIIGGSGGGGGTGSSHSGFPSPGSGGGGGGGAILIASSGTITVTGSITAKGGQGADALGSVVFSAGGGGSGGAIKLVADKIEGEGPIVAEGGLGKANGGSGGTGRIRLEANTILRTARTFPDYKFGYPTTIFVANTPTLKITSIGGINVPAAPGGSYGTPDITLPSTTINPVPVAISAINIPVGTTITVTSVPQYGTATSATATLSGTDASSTASVGIDMSTEHQCIITATTTFTIQTAMYYDGEKIEKVRIASKVGNESEVFYITKSGREITYEKLFASLK